MVDIIYSFIGFVIAFNHLFNNSLLIKVIKGFRFRNLISKKERIKNKLFPMKITPLKLIKYFLPIALIFILFYIFILKEPNICLIKVFGYENCLYSIEYQITDKNNITSSKKIKQTKYFQLDLIEPKKVSINLVNSKEREKPDKYTYRDETCKKLSIEIWKNGECMFRDTTDEKNELKIQMTF
ncbi:MAG: hypothetical protein IPL53_17790 [Ignavibacteria bacterium]|nr:hypothetical protein [Ignavibacteria bacterium]